ncbi:MAG: NADH-quinone oxidoreductase subunit NuoG [Halothiobacillaceae bacterium]
MSDDLITFEVDGITLQGRKGDMLIEVTDAAGITIPRFCYHRKLSIAANCRMCLVEVERAPKPLPACSTPISDGMRVFTKSPKAISAQRSTMEFLLINHPLDCPICDQGGECELQDVAMGYGEGVGQYSETKRVVKDKDIGPLIATDMTRCIHCTRCVRFGDEIAGLRELGATGRSEHMEIGTYIAKSVTSELSGNVIDLCPVGALTAKPSRYTLRPWEVIQHRGVAVHDGIGSNLYLHTRGGRVMRVVPRDNDAVNETWLSDRDRYSYAGLYAEDRLEQPMVREGDQWRVVDWETALAEAARQWRHVHESHGGAGMAALVSPNASTEEHFLVQKLMRSLGSGHVDHRLRQTDFSNDAAAPVMPWLGLDIAQIPMLNAALVVGCDVRKEAPLFGHRLRMASLENGARINFLHPWQQNLTFDAGEQLVGGPDGMVDDLIALCQAAGIELPEALADRAAGVEVQDRHRAVLADLRDGESTALFLGAVAQVDPRYGLIQVLASRLAEATGSAMGFLAAGGNACGAWLAGTVPGRGPGGVEARHGRNAAEILAEPAPAMLLFGIEPEQDSLAGPEAIDRLSGCDSVVVATSYVTEAMRRYATVLLPLGSHVETAGTWVNAEGRWQTVQGAATPVGEARPGWKILRVLGNLMDLEGFEYLSVDEVRTELEGACASVSLDNRIAPASDLQTSALSSDDMGLWRHAPVAMYGGDALQRRALPLQQTEVAIEERALAISPADASAHSLADGDLVEVVQSGHHARGIRVRIDEGVAAGTVRLCAGTEASALLPAVSAAVELRKVAS